MQTVRHQYLFVNSARCKGTTADFDVQIDDGLVSAQGTDERIKITLIDFNMLCDWGNINASNQTMTFKNLVSGVETPIVVPTGFYTMQDIKKTLSTLYPQAIITYDYNTNRFTFTFTQNHQLIFTSKLNKVLGFDTNENPQGTTITSSINCVARSINNLNIYLYNVHAVKHHNIENIEQQGVKKSHMIARIPVTAEPHANIVWINRAEHYGIFVSEMKLSRLRFKFVDDDGIVMDYLNLPPCTFTLKIDYVLPPNNDKTIEQSLGDIKEYLRLLFVSSQLK